MPDYSYILGPKQGLRGLGGLSGASLTQALQAADSPKPGSDEWKSVGLPWLEGRKKKGDDSNNVQVDPTKLTEGRPAGSSGGGSVTPTDDALLAAWLQARYAGMPPGYFAGYNQDPRLLGSLYAPTYGSFSGGM